MTFPWDSREDDRNRPDDPQFLGRFAEGAGVRRSLRRQFILAYDRGNWEKIVHLVLNLSSEQEAELRQLATVAGTDVQSVVFEAIREKLEDGKDSTYREMPYEEWRKEFDAWIASQRSRNPQMDDSRDSIYD